MRKKIQLSSFLLLLSVLTYAQSIKISAPNYVGRSYTFILNKGIKEYKIQTGNIDVSGNISINIPKEYNDYKGIASFLIEGAEPLKTNLIVNHEDFELIYNSPQDHKYINSKENSFLDSIIDGKQPLEIDTTLYACKFIEIIKYMNSLNQVVYGRPSMLEKAQTKIYALNTLDLNTLYTSGLWQIVVDGITKFTPSQDILANDFIRILKRIDSEEIFIHLTENLITITQQYGWNDAFDKIIQYVKDSNKIETPTGDIFDAFKAILVQKGGKAPSIEGLTNINQQYDKILLVFYQDDCPICETQMNYLIENYNSFKEKGIRIISISSEHDENKFIKDASKLPWDDKLCDFKGFAGDNFSNWGVIATPSFFLLDKKHIVLGKYAALKDLNIDL